MAASAASVIAMAGNEVLISPTGQMMIHNVQYGGRGDYREVKKRPLKLLKMLIYPLLMLIS